MLLPQSLVVVVVQPRGAELVCVHGRDSNKLIDRPQPKRGKLGSLTSCLFIYRNDTYLTWNTPYFNGCDILHHYHY